MMFEEIVTMLFLGYSAWTDWRKHEISLILTGVYASVGLIYSFMSGREIQDILIPVLIGAVFLAASVITRGALGMGDGWILLALGCMTGTMAYLRTLGIGLFLSAVISAILLTVFHRNRKTEIPFIPFLFLGYAGGIFI
ncbi:prepilin peptidase [Blautia sp. XA-2221]|uniref:prepilin peptidase n=1 Tax=Blautia sp. XA-2221 TaxID=2903961 RepID=UPI0023780D4F|nr:prepilin peptidase [Blautia sp. XA-2221]